MYPSTVPSPSAAQAYVRCIFMMLHREGHIAEYTYRGMFADANLVWC